jgi:hypothetical protein
MKIIRLIVVGLFLLTGILHVIYFFKHMHDPGIIIALLFGLIFLVTSYLVYISKKIGYYLGLIFTLIPMIMGVVQGLGNLHRAGYVFLSIDFLAFICCIYLVLQRKPTD